MFVPSVAQTVLTALRQHRIRHLAGSAIRVMVLAALVATALPLAAPPVAGAATFGTVLYPGANYSGVDAFENGGTDYRPEQQNYIGSVNTGAKWSAEELAQRFYYVKYGVPSPWGGANPSEMYDIAPSMGLVTVPNGSGAPEYGDLVVWNTNYTGNSRGHVAIVRSVGASSIYVVEQGVIPGGTRSIPFLYGRFTDNTVRGLIKHPTPGQFTPPDIVTAKINSVSPQATAIGGQAVTFSGSATDSQGHAATAYEWTSSIDGVISTAAGFSTSSLAVGAHTISFRARCASGAWSDPAIYALNVVAPDLVTARIDSISPNPAVVGQPVVFSGSATDSLGHAIAGYEWSTDAGLLSTSARFTKSLLPVGTQTIYFRARCANGTWSPIVSQVLTVSEAGPADAVTLGTVTASPSTATFGQAVTFTGSATDALGHALTYQWLEGTTVLSTAASFSTSSLGVGTHTLTFRATCSAGLSASRAVTVVVNAAPVDTVTASILSVSPSAITAGQAVTFAGTATDSLGHAIAAYEWTEGTTVLSTAASFSTSSLAVGTHTIGFRAQCASGVWSPKVYRAVTVSPADAITLGTVTASPSTSTFGQAVTFTGSATDVLGHALSYQWLEGTTVLSTAASFSTSSLGVGTHTLTFRATCSAGLSASRAVTVVVNPAPVDTVTISSAAANPSVSIVGQAVTFTGSATDSLGHALVYQWLEGASVLSNAASFSTSLLAAGTHTITLKVTCSAGTVATRTLTVTVNPVVTDGVTASILSVSPNPATYGRTISFQGSAVDPAGHAISAWEWSEGTRVLSTKQGFSLRTLSVGTHTISFRARCANGTWSPTVTTVVTIVPKGK